MSDLIQENKVRLRSVEQLLKRYALDVANKAFDLLRVAGPVTVRISLSNVAGLVAEEIDPWTAGAGGPFALAGDTAFEEEASTDEFRFHQQAVLERLQNRLASAFGLWREPRAGG